jgi:hypothetical protein
MAALVTAGLVGAAGAVQAVQASASAAPSACQLVHPAEYRAALGYSVRLATGEGSSSCQVWRGTKIVGIIPNINPYNRASVTRLLGSIPGKVRQPSLGPVGWSAVIDGAPTVYAVKHGQIISFQSFRSPGFTPPTTAELVRLTRTAYGRV